MPSTNQGSVSGETRALSAAMSAPVPFRTRAGGDVLHSADRHVQRFAPEADGARRSRSLGALAFVDRLVVPWVTAAQQSTSMRMFGEYIAHGPNQRETNQVSWVFPRPWYQDELDWMAAARRNGGAFAASQRPSDGLFTTRGTFESNRAPAASSMPQIDAHGPNAQPTAISLAAPAGLAYVAPSLAQTSQDQARAYSSLYGADQNRDDAAHAVRGERVGRRRRAAARDPPRSRRWPPR
jgi:hypothetical protein